MSLASKHFQHQDKTHLCPILDPINLCLGQAWMAPYSLNYDFFFKLTIHFFKFLIWMHSTSNFNFFLRVRCLNFFLHKIRQHCYLNAKEFAIYYCRFRNWLKFFLTTFIHIDPCLLRSVTSYLHSCQALLMTLKSGRHSSETAGKSRCWMIWLKLNQMGTKTFEISQNILQRKHDLPWQQTD